MLEEDAMIYSRDRRGGESAVEDCEARRKGLEGLDVRGEPGVIGVRRLFSDEWGMNVEEIR